jgi:hypothetical protein
MSKNLHNCVGFIYSVLYFFRDTKNEQKKGFMDIQTAKINRSVKLIKGFMALVVFMFLLQYYQTSVLDLGAFAGSVGVLSLLRGILLSPSLLTTPVKNWTVSNVTFSRSSNFYFILAFVLILVSAF